MKVRRKFQNGWVFALADISRLTWPPCTAWSWWHDGQALNWRMPAWGELGGSQTRLHIIMLSQSREKTLHKYGTCSWILPGGSPARLLVSSSTELRSEALIEARCRAAGRLEAGRHSPRSATALHGKSLPFCRYRRVLAKTPTMSAARREDTRPHGRSTCSMIHEVSLLRRWRWMLRTCRCNGRNSLAGQPSHATLVPKMDYMYVSCTPTG